MFVIILVFFIVLFLFTYRLGIKLVQKSTKGRALRGSNYFALYLSLWALLPSFFIFFIGSGFSNHFMQNLYLNKVFENENALIKQVSVNSVLKVVNHVRDGGNIDDISINMRGIDDLVILDTAQKYLYYSNISFFALLIFSLLLIGASLFVILKCTKFKANYQKKIEKFVYYVLMFFAGVAVFTTIGILFSLLFQSLLFFKDIPILSFLFGTVWAPANVHFDPENSFGVIPLLTGTILISLIAIFIATIVGVSSAIYMSEYMSKKYRRIVKTAIEILAGIPSIVYGFFAAISFAPIVVSIFKVFFDMSISSETALNAGIVMGVMIIPLISSISDDVLNAVPREIREAAIGMGSMKNEMIRKILFPIALPGIIGSILLGVSRAIGETLIVVMAASLAANLTFNPVEPVTTITTQIVMLLQGDQEFNSPQTLSVFALGLLLLILTFLLNVVALHIVNKYKRVQ